MPHVSELSAQVRAALDAAVAAIGGQPREGQIEMAEAVANALTDRHHLMVQAGTGTGKSLAYLVPALVHGRKVLVATATLALQRQLVERDLPAVVPALEKILGRTITYGIYKGVGNYICLQKMNADEPDPDGELLLEASYLEKDAKRLIAWAKTPGVSGDRDDAPEVDRRVWAANSLSGRECVGADSCAWGAQCFAATAKARAQEADVVVTNHTLLAIEIVDSHPILPERDAVILDEAHHLARLAYVQNDGSEWSTLQTICHESPRLLLLTATPALHNETSFLAMLNLLEPQTYDLTDLDGFRTRIKNRDGVASALDLIQEDMKRIREVRDAADAIREYLADDPLLMQKANELDVIVEKAKNLEVFFKIVKKKITG